MIVSIHVAYYIPEELKHENEELKLENIKLKTQLARQERVNSIKDMQCEHLRATTKRKHIEIRGLQRELSAMTAAAEVVAEALQEGPAPKAMPGPKLVPPSWSKSAQSSGVGKAAEQSS